VIINSIFDQIGNTPLCPVSRLNPYKNVRIYAKLEAFNPGGSIKDRIAYNMIQEAENRGELTKDKTVLEATSGNTGIGLSLVCAAKGYKLLIVMSEGASIERRKIMRAYGAELLLTPANKGTDGAIETVYNMIKEEGNRFFCTDQFNNPDNWMTHYKFTANEIWNDTKGNVDVVVITMGTTGTLMGITRRLRELNPKVRIVGVEPYLGHGIQGLKNMKESYVPGIFNKKEPDSIIKVEDEEAFEMSRRLAREEGLFVGMSSGAAMAIALKEAANLKEGNIVVLFPDSGERYLSTNLFPITETYKQGEKLTLYNTFTRKKEPFKPLNANEIKLYSCGPTANQYMHLGLARRMLFTDLLTRLFEYKGFKVQSIMNITDIDDKTVATALQENKALSELTQSYINAFFEDITQLNIKYATFYPKASEHVDDMIAITDELIQKGFAYVKHGSVYFDISKLSAYGKLSKIELDSIEFGKTVDLDNYEKDHPADFTLFKRISLEELKKGLGFDSKWGKIRPGWHIECVAMSRKYLDANFDIHTSSSDLIFPHHENEIAIAKALWGKNLANLWIHNDPVFYKGKKISIQNNNVVLVRDLINEGFTGREIRFFLIRTHYRKPINYSVDEITSSVKQLQRFDKFICELEKASQENIDEAILQETEIKIIRDLIINTKDNFIKSIRNDLNIPNAIGNIFNVIRIINPYIHKNSLPSSFARELLSMMLNFDKILGIINCKPYFNNITDEEHNLINERELARRTGNWQKADELRYILLKKGITLLDTSNGVKCKRETGQSGVESDI
jgi:cysteinyl-tRNA synthetase